MKTLRVLILPLAAIAVGGCGGESFETAKVTGSVECDGKRLTSGRVMFQPIPDGEEKPGKPAFGDIGLDGTFELSTYVDGDGAVVGKHRVVVYPRYADEDDEQDVKASKIACSGEAPIEYTVVGGEPNRFVIKLVSAKKKKKRRVREEEDDD